MSSSTNQIRAILHQHLSQPELSTRFPPSQPIKELESIVRRRLSPSMIVCEVGCYDGVTTATYIPLVASVGGMVIVVDWFMGSEGSPGNLHSYRPEESGNVFNKFCRSVAPYRNTIRMLRGRSVDMACYIPPRSLDICFVDADHRYTEFSADLDAWEEKVKPGGLFCGHDCEQLPPPRRFTKDELQSDYIDGMHCGVIQAVWERYGARAKLLPDTIWMVEI